MYATAIYYTYLESLVNKGVWKVQRRIYTFFTPLEKVILIVVKEGYPDSLCIRGQYGVVQLDNPIIM